MKKFSTLFALSLLITICFCACGEKKPALLTATDYDLDAETAQTVRGVKIGDGPETFLAAYRDYDILSSIGGGDYLTLAVEDIPFDASLTTILPSFFVDGNALEIDSFCEENGIEKEQLLSFLTDENYLSSHTVVYRYLVFTWENGVITDILSEAMDYNLDGSFYEAN